MSFRLSRVLHAGYLLEAEGFQIIFDPIFENPFSYNCYPFPNVEFDFNAIENLNLNAVIISHYHDDHFSIESLRHINRNTPIYFFSVFPELFELLQKLGFTTIHPVELNHKIRIGPFQITPLEALDQYVDSFFHIQVNDLNILNVVDAWIGPEIFKNLLGTKWDLVLWPFQTLREVETIAPSVATASDRKIPFEWLDQLTLLKPKAIVPSSCQFQFEKWSWLNTAFFPISYAGFHQQIREVLPETQVLQLQPGEISVYDNQEWKKHGRLDWIKPVGDLNEDYQFDDSLRPPSTLEIATHFPALTDTQKSFIQSYCESELLLHWGNLDTESYSIFAKPQQWKLKIFDQSGLFVEFQYLIMKKHIQAMPLTEDQTWTTEIIGHKLISALQSAESLTSLYIRVIPAKNIDPSVDPLEDPLIRSLYEGQIGSYQKAQLKKIGY